MDEFQIIKRYFSNIAKKNKYAMNPKKTITIITLVPASAILI